jgi:hypothetical protein
MEKIFSTWESLLTADDSFSGFAFGEVEFVGSVSVIFTCLMIDSKVYSHYSLYSLTFHTLNSCELIVPVLRQCEVHMARGVQM